MLSLTINTSSRIGETVSELIGEVFRFVGRPFIEIVLDFLIRRLGYLLCEPFKKDVNPDGALVAVVGVVCWVIVVVAVW